MSSFKADQHRFWVSQFVENNKTKPEAYFHKAKSDREYRLHYIIQYYQWKMKFGSLNETEGRRYIRVLQAWQKEFGTQFQSLPSKFIVDVKEP